jgi:hypothetical protein
MNKVTNEDWENILRQVWHYAWNNKIEALKILGQLIILIPLLIYCLLLIFLIEASYPDDL